MIYINIYLARPQRCNRHQVSFFINAKADSLFHQRIKPVKLRWTQVQICQIGRLLIGCDKMGNDNKKTEDCWYTSCNHQMFVWLCHQRLFTKANWNIPSADAPAMSRLGDEWTRRARYGCTELDDFAHLWSATMAKHESFKQGKTKCFHGFRSTSAPPTFIVVLFGKHAMFFLAEVMEFKLDWNYICTVSCKYMQVHVTSCNYSKLKTKSESQATFLYISQQVLLAATTCRCHYFGSGRGGRQEEGQEGPEVSKSHCAIPRLSLILKSSWQGLTHPTSMIGYGWK